MNPFQHGVVVSGGDFCPRPDLMNELRAHIRSQQNCVVRGGRRMGKTSGVLEAIRAEKGVSWMLVNCWGKSSLTSLADAISESFLASQSRRGLSLKTILSGFAQMRPQATIDPQTGHPTFSVDLASSREFTPRSLERVFEPIGEEGKKQPLVVVLDEFQALLQLAEHREVMATLRGAIQLQPAVTYFYLGSIRNQMDAIFNDPKQPFFKSAASVSVGPIPRETYAIYLRKKFATGRRDIEDAAIERVFELANDITGDVQQLCSQIWNTTDAGEVIDVSAVGRGLERIHQAERESNSRIIDLLTPGQVRVLLGLAKTRGEQPTSKSFLKVSGISQPSSVTKSLSRLENEGLVFRDSKGYRFFSPFFRTWLLSEGPR